MNKIKILPALIFTMWAMTFAGQAQTNVEIGVSKSSNEESKDLKFERGFSLKTEIVEKPAIRREFVIAEKSSETDPVSSASARQSTYVRPTKEARLKRYASDAFGVPALVGATFGATFSQIGNNPPEWERNIGGFGKRFASSYATNAIRNSISYGLSETFRLDNRFEKRGTGSFGKRLKHVLLGSYTSRTKTGRRIPDFPYVTGTYAASIIANEAWFPDRFSYKDGLRDGTVSLGVRFGVNLLREFVFPK